jgi:tRNA nucleotidyltransferase (CCA-adding enzyme)
LAVLLSDLEPKLAERVLRDLRFSNADAARTGQVLARWHALAAPMTAALAAPTPPSDATVRRWVAQMGRTRVSAVMRLAAARWGARRAAGAPAPARVAALYRRALRSAFRDPVEIGDLAVTGDDLVRAEIAPGPQLGRILHALLDEVLEEPARNTPAALVARALELHRGLSNPE